MDLQQRRSGRQHSKFVMRLGVCLVTVSLLLGLAAPPKAEAVALTGTAIAVVAGSFLAACGLPFLVEGMDRTGLTASIEQLLQEFLDEEFFGVSVEDWFAGFGSAGLAIKSGKLILARPLADDLRQFAQWVTDNYASSSGVHEVYNNSSSFPSFSSVRSSYIIDYPSSISFSRAVTFHDSITYNNCAGSFSIDSPGTYVRFSPSDVPRGQYFYVSDFLFLGLSSDRVEQAENGVYTYYTITDSDLEDGSVNLSITVTWGGLPFTASAGSVYPLDLTVGAYVSYSDSKLKVLSVNRAESLAIPQELTEGQSLALDVGATDSMSIEEIAQGVLDDIIAGDLTASAEAVEEVVSPEEPPDVGDLGLPDLGAALISRFPFCIPWDIAKGIKLLAAPAKVPYFEVDFFEPIADRVGGWQGSTKIVLDFSQFEILGQLSRWTSTVGFCLMLAGATKRFIWTA